VANQELLRLKEIIATTPTLQANQALQESVTGQEAELQDWQMFIDKEESRFSLYAFGESLWQHPKKLLVFVSLLQ
jgi:hypothetical protein